MDRARVLNEMGIKPIWALREHAVATEATPIQVVPVAQLGFLTWPELAEGVASCRACGLCEGRKQALMGAGDQHADWMFVGDAPSAQDDAQGQIFTDEVGRLLDAMLGAAGLVRDSNVYLTNAVKCKPSSTQRVSATELAKCRAYLACQIALVQPKVIIALGELAAHSVLNTETPFADLRAKLHHLENIAVIVSDHPTTLLRNPAAKAQAWEDLCLAMDQLTV